MDPDATVNVLRKYPETIVGIKIGHFEGADWTPFDRAPVQLAAWFHDAVYDGAGDDEQRSAALAEAELAAAEYAALAGVERAPEEARAGARLRQSIMLYRAGRTKKAASAYTPSRRPSFSTMGPASICRSTAAARKARRDMDWSCFIRRLPVAGNSRSVPAAGAAGAGASRYSQ